MGASSLATGDEAILILEPGPGSRLTSPIHIAGVADLPLEQRLMVRLALADGSELALVPTQTVANHYALDVPFTISGEQQAFLQVYAISPYDNGIDHLAAVGLTLGDTGPATIVPVTPHSERIAIHHPLPGDNIRGGMVHVEGFALASFEQTLLVEVVGVDGGVIAAQPVTVEAPDLGQPGPFSIDIPYGVISAGRGRIVVRDVSPAFGGDVHRASVEVTLEAAEPITAEGNPSASSILSCRRVRMQGYRRLSGALMGNG